jgi:hypothetical protein
VVGYRFRSRRQRRQDAALAAPIALSGDGAGREESASKQK